MTNICTVVLNWNGVRDTLECLESLSKIEHEVWKNHVLVVDNGSTDGSVAIIRTKFPEVLVLENKENRGFSEGNNQGFTWAIEHKMDFVFVLNNDTVLPRRALDLLVKTALSDSSIGAVMPVIKYYQSREIWYAGGRFIRPFGRVSSLTKLISEQVYEVPLFSGCAVLIPVKVLEKVGFFNTRYYLYLEDTDLAMRIREAGYKIVLVPESSIYHKVSRSSGGSVTPNPIYYQVRNNLLLIKEKSSNFVERGLGCGYMILLSSKIILNLFTRRLPQKYLVFRAVVQAWLDFLTGRLGRRV